MASLAQYLPALGAISLILLSGGVAKAEPSGADAEDEAPTEALPKAPATTAPATTSTSPTSTTDAALLEAALDDENTIVVWGARKERVFNRDSPLRFTGEELRKRGANTVADALDLLPEVYIRAAGRGGRQVDIRGARKGSVKILLDGISIADPFYGNIDLSAIPVTDIEQIRVSAAPASPIDGPGGPGGVIEIITSDAVGGAYVRARLTAASAPSAEASATGRATLAPNFAVRVSASGTVGADNYELLEDGAVLRLGEDREQSVGNVRLEYRKGKRRIVTNIWTQQVSFVVPPARDGSSNILVIEGESQGRLGLRYDDAIAGTRVSARAHYHLLRRDSTYYEDAELSMAATSEELAAARSGLALFVNRPIGDSLFVIGSAHVSSDTAEVEGFDGLTTEGRATIATSAAEVQYDGRRLKARASGGVAVPIGLGASPWPEFKLSVTTQVHKALELALAAGHKGRTPTLRERYRLDIGNQSLGPEKALYAEAGAVVRPASDLRLGVKGYGRRTNGLIRFDADQRELINTEDLNIVGVEATLDGAHRFARFGTSYAYARATSEILGDDPLDFFPEHRATAWLGVTHGRYGATARVQYFGEQIDRNTTLDSRVLGQLTARAEIAETYLLTLRAENIANHSYEQRVGVLAPGRTAFLSLQGQWH